MSLFKVNFCWSTQCPDTEDNYDGASLLCARFGLSDSEKDYIVVASHSGFLSIFQPHIEWENADESGGYCVTDLLLETKLKSAILGIYTGKFNGNTQTENIQLAVLHINSLAIYNLQIINGVADHGSQACLNLLVEHFFKRAAFALCMGHFGKVKGREFYCVVHLDGTLTFYEQDGISYECRFPGCRPLPSPVMYCERTDSFVRIGAAWTLECYTYQDLAHASINKSRYEPAWIVCLGEEILDLAILQTKENSSSIILLGEKNLIGLNDNGKLEFILKFEYSPKCFYSFLVGYYWESSSRLITAIVSESGKLHIYDGTKLIWAAQLQQEAPVAVKRSNLNNLSGGIVTLGPTGQLAVGYLGSELFTFTAAPLRSYNSHSSATALNFQQACKELAQLEQEIKESIDLDYVAAVNQRIAEDLLVTFDIDSKIHPPNEFDALLMEVPANVAVLELPTCRAILKLQCKTFFAEMQIAFSMSAGIRCSQETVTYTDVDSGTSKTLTMDFFIAELVHVQSTRVDVLISVINAMGIPRVILKSSFLPLEMFFKPILPAKTASIKLTFNIEAEMVEPKLNKFFPQFIDDETSDPHALGLACSFPIGESELEVVTIVAAKNSNRIRVQSDSLEMFPLIMEHLISTARSKTGNNNSNIDEQNAIRAGAYFPSHEILHRIDKHREMQENIKNQTVVMDDLWSQFKSLQRQLQEKAEDQHQESLLIQIEQNYENLIAEGDKLIEMRNKEKRLASNLSIAIAVANLIISCLPLDKRIVNITSAILCTPTDDWTEQSWEESMSPGISMLHHYGLLDRSRNPSKASDHWNTSWDVFDFNRFKRNFLTLFDRILGISSSADQLTQSQNVNSIAERAPSDVINFVAEDCFKEEEEEEHSKKFIQKAASQDEGKIHTKNINENSDFTDSDLTAETSDWVNESYQLPSSEELFNDLGIWW